MLTISNSSTSRAIGWYSYGWSHLGTTFSSITGSSNDTASANSFKFYAFDTPNPSNSNIRFYGFSLRCLSTAVEGEERWES